MLSAVPFPPFPSSHEPAEREHANVLRRWSRLSVVWAGVRCGLLAAAATAGAIVGFARHDAAGVLAPFATSGRMLLGVAAGEGRPAQLLALAAGLALHVTLVVAWAVLFSFLAGALRGVRLLLAAALFAAAVYAASRFALPALLRLGHGVRAFPPQVAVLYGVLALALAIGMRLAFSSRAGGAQVASSGG